MTLACGCGGPVRHAASGPTTTLIAVDRWHSPAVGSEPSTEGFCTLMTAVYRHEAALPLGATLKVREEILSDYVNEAPRMVAVAPTQITAAARTYFTTVAATLKALDKAGLDSTKMPRGSASATLSPAFLSASTNVLDFSQRNCHYSIGG